MGKKKKYKKIDENTLKDEVVIDEEVVDKDLEVSVEEKVVEETKEEVSEELVYETPKKENKNKSSGLMNTTLVILLLCSLIYLIMKLFYGSGDEAILSLIEAFILLLFTSLFVCIGFSIGRRKKSLFIYSSLLLIGFFGFSVYTDCFINIGNKVLNFTGMSLSEVIEWSESNEIELIQDFEYSDMIDEYHIISQDILAGTDVNDVDKLTIAISEGPNPSKEVNVPSMVGWESEKVLEFILENHLSNVSVEWIESEDKEDTVTNQSKIGNLRRNDEIKIVFSAGEVISEENIKLIDFTGKSEFEVVFYLKQHHVKYEIVKDFSKNVKKGNVIKQSIKAGTSINPKDEKLVVTISKGPEIKISELKRMSMSDVTEWVIENKLRLEFSDAYDDSIDENHVIDCNYSVGDVVEEGTVIKVTISKGKLTMQSFDNLNDFRTWAQKYSINYQEEHEFSDSVDAGNVIKYSYKAGETIKNGDTIVVVISDGKKISVPNVIGLNKDDATNKLKNLGLGYNFVYSYSSSEKGKAIKQSISAGSGVAKGTTITVTLSNGPKPQSSSNNNSGGGNSTPQPTCTSTATHTLIIQPNWVQGGSANATISTLKSKLASKYVFD